MFVLLEIEKWMQMEDGQSLGIKGYEKVREGDCREP